MPNRNGTGPMGAGAMTGRKLGNCAAASAEGVAAAAVTGCRRRAGQGRKQGFGFRHGQAGTNTCRAEEDRPLLRRRHRAGKGCRTVL